MNNFTPQSRYIMPQFTERTPYGVKTQDAYSKLFEDRIVFLGAPVDDASADDIMSQLLVLESQDADRDIIMYINSPGGTFTALTAIYDTMMYVKPDIQTVCLGQASSVSSIILAAGTNGKRFALPNARVMIHQPSTGGERGQASDIEIQAAEALRISKWMEETVSLHTGQPVNVVAKDIERDKFFTAHEAVAYGIIDQVLEPRKRSLLTSGL